MIASFHVPLKYFNRSLLLSSQSILIYYQSNFEIKMSTSNNRRSSKKLGKIELTQRRSLKEICYSQFYRQNGLSRKSTSSASADCMRRTFSTLIGARDLSTSLLMTKNIKYDWSRTSFKQNYFEPHWPRSLAKIDIRASTAKIFVLNIHERLRIREKMINKMSASLQRDNLVMCVSNQLIYAELGEKVQKIKGKLARSKEEGLFQIFLIIGKYREQSRSVQIR